MNELALFAGAGGGILGSHLLGWRTICAVEIENYPRRVLLARQRDGILPPFPIWDDIRTFDGTPWKGRVDVVTGGFPCQDISAAGKGAGIGGERSGLWSEMARVIREVQPRYALVENSPLLVGRGLAVVLGDLAEMGYDARWGVLGARDAGAPHKRDRIWILAHAQKPGAGDERKDHRTGRDQIHPPDNAGRLERKTDKPANRQIVPDAQRPRLEGLPRTEPVGHQPGRDEAQPNRPACEGRISWWDRDPADLPHPERLRESQQEGVQRDQRGRIVNRREIETAYALSRIWGIESRLGRVAHGVPHRVDRLKAVGNAQVPAVAALAWLTLTADLPPADHPRAAPPAPDSTAPADPAQPPAPKATPTASTKRSAPRTASCLPLCLQLCGCSAHTTPAEPAQSPPPAKTHQPNAET